ncbi:MAG: nucleotidyl transferase AbiEii/AbiGii toxin family protein [Candidatus Calescibacterium sp.]|jgi:predicted nucleotidyltransferase component of viral defense system
MAFDISKHRNVLLMILKDIYSDATISPSLGFKGETALHLFYNLPRFSIDLDFDLLDEEKKNMFSRKS